MESFFSSKFYTQKYLDCWMYVIYDYKFGWSTCPKSFIYHTQSGNKLFASLNSEAKLIEVKQKASRVTTVKFS